jgi:hypothetical protein
MCFFDQKVSTTERVNSFSECSDTNDTQIGAHAARSQQKRADLLTGRSLLP